MCKKKGISLAVLLAVLALPFEMLGADLVKDGKSNAVIVLPANLSGGEGYAAVELSTYLQKITGASLEIRTAPVPGLYNIYLGTTAARMPPEISKLYYKLKNDGFLIVTGKDAMYVTSRVPTGVIYGVYEILKKYGDVRWFYPGPDGEYVPQKPTFSVPEGMISVNPDFTKRSFNLTGGPQNHMAYPTMQWMLRNNMTGAVSSGLHTNLKAYGGHDWWTLLPKELFTTRPELFPMVGGKRHAPSWKASDPGYANPCVSNPETVKIMLDTVIKKINADRRITVYEILQNDTPQWCECEKCKKLDSKADHINHSISNRFWMFANALIREVKENAPGMEITAWAYINAEDPPDTVKPDTRCNLRYCMVRRCHIHSLQDESCSVNRKFRERLQAWRKLGMPIWTYEYSAFVPHGSRISAPFEKIHSEDMKFYKKIGLIGYSDERAPIVETPAKYFIKEYLAGGKGSMANSWYYDAISRYFQAYFMWNPDADFETVMEDFGSKFYGRAWPEMKEYRTLLRNRYEKAPTHFMYGTPSIAAGRVLDDASKKILAEKLEKALAAASADKAVCERIQRDKEILEGLVAKRKDYQDVQKMQLTIGQVKAPPSEEDWKAVSPVTEFTDIRKEAVSQKTSAKVLYDSKNIYFRIEAFDDKMGVIASRETERDGILWKDSTFELFITPPALGGKYLHFVVNPAGTVFDAMTVHPSDSDKTFDARADVKVTKLNDRWIAEIAIPFESLGGTPKPGEEWKVNIARGRVLTDGTKSEYSSWSNGEFHGVDVHRGILFGK